MHVGSSVQKKIRTGKKANIWLALFAALCAHLIIIFLPVDNTLKVSEPTDAQIEVQLTAYKKPSEPTQEEPEPISPIEEIQPEIIFRDIAI